MRRLRDENDKPLFASVKGADSDGGVKQAYKKVLLFEQEDCGSLKTYHAKQAEHHMSMANWYARMQERLTGDQLDLPFPDRD